MRGESDLTLSPPIEFAATGSIRLSLLERMPTWLICIPLVLQWIVLAVRYRSATLPSAANPEITSGGLVGEGKLEYFRDMGSLARAATARHCAVSTASLPSSATLLQCMDSAGLTFPVIVKPNLGLCGYGVRLIVDMDALHTYLAAFPVYEDVVLQQYLPAAGEAGIFYARDPATDQGRIIGLALRDFPRVTGNGRHTVAQLIAHDPRARRLVRAPHHECAVDDTRVPMPGEVVRLATIGSTRVGGLYRNGAACITPQLTAAIDAIARDMPTFYCGRFDVRFDREQDLSAGTGFSIMEVNGAGSEAIHAWDPAIGVIEGFRMIFAKQRTLFAIGDARRRSGVQPIGLLALAQLWRRQRRLIALYPPSN